MGQYNKAIITAAGESLIARAIVGEIQLEIAKAKTSDHKYPDSTDFKALTDMQGIKQVMNSPDTKVLSNDLIQTRTLFGNEEIQSTYYIQNIGLYAMDGTQEVLFCIVTAATPDEMPQYNGVAATSYIYNVQPVVQDAETIHITVNPSGTATIQDVLERVNATGGDISETVIETLEPIDTKYPIPNAGEKVKTFLGKILTFLRNIKPLEANKTLYVATTGSDITGDGTSAKPYKTIQHAIDVLPKDLGSYEVIIQVADGTYAEDLIIAGFHSGVIRLYSSNISSITTVCSVNSFLVSQCSSYIFISGINIITTTKHGIEAYNVHEIIVRYCSATGVNSIGAGYRFAECNFQIFNSIASNKNSALLAYKSYGFSANWGSTSGNNFGIYAEIGSIVSTTGTQPQGEINLRQITGGMFINENGTQISELITSGLSCTWVINAVGKWITADEFQEITGKEYEKE